MSPIKSAKATTLAEYRSRAVSGTSTFTDHGGVVLALHAEPALHSRALAPTASSLVLGMYLCACSPHAEPCGEGTCGYSKRR